MISGGGSTTVTPVKVVEGGGTGKLENGLAMKAVV